MFKLAVLKMTPNTVPLPQNIETQHRAKREQPQHQVKVTTAIRLKIETNFNTEPLHTSEQSVGLARPFGKSLRNYPAKPPPVPAGSAVAIIGANLRFGNSAANATPNATRVFQCHPGGTAEAALIFALGSMGIAANVALMGVILANRQLRR